MRFKRESLFAPVSVPCFDWKGEDGESLRRTVIISPIRVVELKDGSIQISWGCSRGAFCKDQTVDTAMQHRLKKTTRNLKNRLISDSLLLLLKT